MKKITDDEALKDLNWQLAHGMDVNKPSETVWRTPLAWAEIHGWIRCAKALVDAGADVKTKLRTGAITCQLIHWATEIRDRYWIQRLLQQGVDVNAGDGNYWTPLYIAISNGDVEVAQLLIDSGANLEAASWLGETPLHVAARSQRNSAKCTKVLIDAGASPLAKIHNNKGRDIERQGKTPLDLALDSGNTDSANLIRARLAKLQGNELDQAINEVIGNKPLPIREGTRLGQRKQ